MCYNRYHDKQIQNRVLPQNASGYIALLATVGGEKEDIWV